MRLRVSSWVMLPLVRCRIPKRIALFSVIILHIINFLLRSTTFVKYYCQTECDLQLWSVPFPPEDELIISHIRKNVLDPHQDEVKEPLTKNDFENQPWAEVGQWDLIQKVIRNTLGNIKNGVFVEVGAGNGVFLSHTSWLESEMGWTGLLVEPRQSSYSSLRRRRKAMAANVCVSDTPFNHKDLLWQPKNTEDMPSMYREVADGKTTLLRYVAMEDRELGVVNNTQCFTLDSLLMAAGLSPKGRIDLLVIHTMGGEGMIIDTLEKANLVMLAVRNRGGIDHRYIMYAAERLGMNPFKDVPPDIDFLFYLNKKVDIVKKFRNEGETT